MAEGDLSPGTDKDAAVAAERGAPPPQVGASLGGAARPPAGEAAAQSASLSASSGSFAAVYGKAKPATDQGYISATLLPKPAAADADGQHPWWLASPSGLPSIAEVTESDDDDETPPSSPGTPAQAARRPPLMLMESTAFELASAAASSARLAPAWGAPLKDGQEGKHEVVEAHEAADCGGPDSGAADAGLAEAEQRQPHGDAPDQSEPAAVAAAADVAPPAAAVPEDTASQHHQPVAPPTTAAEAAEVVTDKQPEPCLQERQQQAPPPETSPQLLRPASTPHALLQSPQPQGAQAPSPSDRGSPTDVPPQQQQQQQQQQHSTDDHQFQPTAASVYSTLASWGTAPHSPPDRGCSSLHGANGSPPAGAAGSGSHLSQQQWQQPLPLSQQHHLQHMQQQQQQQQPLWPSYQEAQMAASFATSLQVRAAAEARCSGMSKFGDWQPPADSAPPPRQAVSLAQRVQGF